MRGNCTGCWHRGLVAVGSYTTPTVDRCWHWEYLVGGLKVAGGCGLWQPMTEEEEQGRIAYFNQTFREWRTAQREKLEVRHY